MIEQVYWYAKRPIERLPPLAGDHRTDIAIVGGGIAGLSAAQWLVEHAAGTRVVVLEADTCGAGASGRSSGFLTPDSELQLTQLTRRFGDDAARELWTTGDAACGQIRENITRFGIDCDFVPADSLYIAADDRGFPVVREEYHIRQRLGFGARLYDRTDVSGVVGSEAFAGGVRYPDTFGIDSFAYVQGLRDALRQQGVQVFEGSRVVEVARGRIRTDGGHISAEKVIVSTDRQAPRLGVAARNVSQAQTALLLTEPLGDPLLRSVFPGGGLLVWDTDLVYQYFRVTGDQRLLFGGGLMRKTYAREESHGDALPRHLQRYAASKFPQLRDVRFTHWWPGLIGVTKDFLPLAGADPDDASRLVALCGAGLPWSAVAGRVAAQLAIEGSAPASGFFRPDRSFTALDVVQPILGKRATFALSHYYTKTRPGRRSSS